MNVAHSAKVISRPQLANAVQTLPYLALPWQVEFLVSTPVQWDKEMCA